MGCEGKGGEAGTEFISTLCALDFFINALLYRIVKETKHFQGEGGGSWYLGGGINLSLGLGEIPGFPP